MAVYVCPKPINRHMQKESFYRTLCRSVKKEVATSLLLSWELRCYVAAVIPLSDYD